MSDAARKRRHPPALVALVLVAALVCMLLAWWQLSRYESASGTAQNLGYALQWPAFAVAVLWAYRRFVILESEPEQARTQTRLSEATEIPAGLLPERPATPSASSFADPNADSASDELRDYNAYLAQLHHSDMTTSDTSAADAPHDQRKDSPS